MTTVKQAPGSLKVVAALFIICGALAALEIVVSIIHGHISLNLGVLGLFIGRGLLRFRPAWHAWALAFTWFAIILGPLFLAAVLADCCPNSLSLFGWRLSDTSPEVAVLTALGLLALGLWQYRVLTRNDIVGLFRRPDSPLTSSPSPHKD